VIEHYELRTKFEKLGGVLVVIPVLELLVGLPPLKNNPFIHSFAMIVRCLLPITVVLFVTASADSRQLQDEEENLVLEFSLWHPRFRAQDAISGDSDLFLDPVLDIVQNFLCDETDLVVMQDDQDVCQRTENPEGQSKIAYSNFVVSDGAQDHIRWTTWVFSYGILRVGDLFVDQANEVMDGQEAMENVAQLALDVQILEGAMDERLEDLRARMSLVGQESEAFEEVVLDFMQYWDYSAGAKALRWVGVVMLLVNLVMLTLLTRLGRERRLDREQDAVHRRDERGGLVTEAGVDHMLDVGRRESLKAIVGSSEFIRPSTELASSQYGRPYVVQRAPANMIPSAAQLDVVMECSDCSAQ
jgi:hypothetical protein